MLKGICIHKMPRRRFLSMSSASMTALLLSQGCGGLGDALRSPGQSSDVQRVSTDTSPDGVYSYMRNQALSFRRARYKIPAPPPDAPIWGALMESNYSDSAFTLLALLDGTTSVYISNGGGVIGGEGHESIREANAAFIRTANQVRPHLEPCESFPVPAEGQTIFYARTDSGVLTAGGFDAVLVKGQQPLSPLFGAGHALLMRLFQKSQGVD